MKYFFRIFQNYRFNLYGKEFQNQGDTIQEKMNQDNTDFIQQCIIRAKNALQRGHKNVPAEHSSIYNSMSDDDNTNSIIDYQNSQTSSS